MATIKENQVLEATLSDAIGDEYTFKINNPRNDLTQQDVSSAFFTMTEAQWWLSPKNYERFLALTKAEIVTTTVVRHAVGEE